MFEFFQVNLSAGVQALIFRVPHQALDGLGEQVLPVRVDHETGRALQQFAERIVFCNVCIQGNGHVERRGQFGDFLERRFRFVGVGVKDQDGGIIIQGALDIGA